MPISDVLRAPTKGRSVAAAGLIALALTMASAPLSSQAATAGTLTAGHRLTAGASITSPDGLNTLTMQSDGNLVEYSGGTAIWCTDTNGIANGGYLSMDTGGNATVYTSSGSAAWTSGSSGTGSANYLAVQDDGNVVVYTSADKAVYSATARSTTLFPGMRLRGGQSIYSVSENYRATMGTDGNFVLWGGSSRLWSSGTGAAGGYVTMQSDGDLAVYTSGGSKVWSSGTSDAGSTLVMQDDANLVMYRSLSNSAPWTSHTYNGAAMTPQHYARQYMLANYRWGADKYPALYNLWTRESGWRYDAVNPVGGDPSTRPYGIPQAYPGSKMSANGSDWLSSFKTQIRWGTGYIKAVYGNPRVAWQHSLDHGWYGPVGR